jgi:hypothetical protein
VILTEVTLYIPALKRNINISKNNKNKNLLITLSPLSAKKEQLH